ncbi:MAG TPA: hypothetical protein VK752_18445 [Bryobacteraceae bacterium]|jgi:hypothetical protein|nr:hypothetical protein [Bryobacteraceae bacterium]
MVLPVRQEAALRVERLSLVSGAELITFFERLPDDPASATRPELPLIAILKDNLNDSDPSNDRIRQVWVFTYSQPSVWQRMAGGVPFLYHRAGLDRGPGEKPPRPVMDLGDPSRGMWAGLAFTGVQSEVLNPIGAIARLTTHSFFGNYGEYRKTHIWEAADALTPELSTALNSGLTEAEIAAVEERLELTGRPLGGLVADEYLEKDHEKQRIKETETRGHNWELLRQRAEESGLYLEPLQPAAPSASLAILWVAQPDLEEGAGRTFDGQFLNISNPFADERLRHWNGYSETWSLDRLGVAVSTESDGAEQVRMIPLAMYALDHPRTPLLLVDFRGSGHPPRREIGLRIAEDVSSGVFWLTGLGNLGYLAAKSSLMFIHNRHGGATDRSARRRAFVFERHAIGVDSTMDTNLRKELLSRIEKVDVNPIERSWDQEIRDSRKQYEALIAYAQKTGLEREIARCRGDEMTASVHGKGARVLLNVASIGTLGLYRHHDAVDDSSLAKLDQQRRTAWLKLQPKSLPPGQDAVLANGKPSPLPAWAGLLQ